MRCSWRDEPAATSARTAAGSADPRGWGLRLVLPRERRRAADRQSQVCATRACVQGPLTPSPSPAKGRGKSRLELIALSPFWNSLPSAHFGTHYPLPVVGEGGARRRVRGSPALP